MEGGRVTAISGGTRGGGGGQLRAPPCTHPRISGLTLSVSTRLIRCLIYHRKSHLISLCPM